MLAEVSADVHRARSSAKHSAFAASFRFFVRGYVSSDVPFGLCNSLERLDRLLCIDLTSRSRQDDDLNVYKSSASTL